MRGFEKITINEYRKKRNENEYSKIKLPKRGTKNSAGYDFYLPYSVELKPKEAIVIATGIKTCMKDDEVLMLFIRSSLGLRGLRLKNQVGIIDSDYYNNSENEGHILVAIENTSNENIILKENERFVQGIFLKYLLVDEEDEPQEFRQGGLGSTSK